MLKHPLYLLYGIAVLGTLSMAEYRGWSFQSINEQNNVPKSIRDNPGAYRPSYGFYPRYMGGK